ncbi:hypothetical protein PAPHI01_2274 [Pancytospora philotis]|nr:hypothetical protein PAPHI01_2274 [Pancytospora philotis]
MKPKHSTHGNASLCEEKRIEAQIAQLVQRFDLHVPRNELYALLKKEDNAPIVVNKDATRNTDTELHHDVHESRMVWPADTLPGTRYTQSKTLRHLSKVEDIAKTEVEEIKPKKLVGLLHATDIMLIREVSAADLLAYDGTRTSVPVAHLQNKNTGILNWLAVKASFKYLERMMKHAAHRKNYNILVTLIGAAQRKKLKHRQMKLLLMYKEMCHRMDGGVFPFDWLLEDCADSNVNVKSEIASERFCKIIACLERMKQIELPGRIRERSIQLVYSKAWEYLNYTAYTTEVRDETDGLCLIM